MTQTRQPQPPNADAEIEFEPIGPEPSWDASLTATVDHSPRVGLAAGAGPSLAGAVHDLRRRRLGAVALFLTVGYGVFFVWDLLMGGGHPWSIRVLPGIRMAIAGVVAAIVMGRAALSRDQVRALEYGLFGTLTLLLCVALYLVDHRYLVQGDIASAEAYLKNGVIQLVILMVLYGVLLPNDAISAAKVVLTMALAPIATLAALRARPEIGSAIDQLNQIEHAGANALIVLVGAGLAIYGAKLVNGLRADLHAARRFGQYQLGQKLGAGGMGEVYMAEHQLLKRPCALKLIRADQQTEPLAMKRFEREVQSAARLSHPNVIAIYDYGHADDGSFYYVMEHLPGMDLGELVRRFGPLAPGRAIYLGRQVCGALAEAHALGLVHRDLKPANVFVAIRGGEFDVAKVLDFGLVKLLHSPGAAELTTDQVVSGTPTFMSPEQAMGEHDVDGRVDQYALGAVLYFALTGRPPFEGATATALMIAHARDPVVPPSKYRPDLPADLEAVILRCLAKKPAERFENMKALSQALAHCASAAEWDGDKAEAWWSAQAQQAIEAGEPATASA